MNLITTPHAPVPRRSRAVIRNKDVVLTGCGRVYIFPSDLSQAARLAGPGHYAHRVGYVEPAGGAWVARDLGNREVGTGTLSRPEALQRVARAAGWFVLPQNWSAMTVIGKAVTDETTNRGAASDVYVDGLGSVFLGAATRDHPRTIRRHATFGAVWDTGHKFAALQHGASSTSATFHSSRWAALRALVPRRDVYLLARAGRALN